MKAIATILWSTLAANTHRKFCQFAAKPLEFMADTDFGQGTKKVSPQPQEASSSGGRGGKGALNATLN